MWHRRLLGTILACGLAGGTAATREAARPPLRQSACTPTVSGAPAVVFDGNVQTLWHTPGRSEQQIVTIDLGCDARVFRFRRYMSCDAAPTGSGTNCSVVNRDGKRHLGFDGVDFASSAAGPFQSAASIGATGWEAYRSGQGFDGLPYGWTPWLDLKGVSARIVRFVFVDAGDNLNEIELEYEEGGGTVPGVTVTQLDVPFTAVPVDITVGSDRALWITEQGAVETSSQIARLTTQGDFSESAVPPLREPAALGLTSGPDGAIWYCGTTDADDGAIGRFTLSHDLTRFAIPSKGLPTRIRRGPDGNLWFTEIDRDFVGRVTPAGVVSEFPAGEGHGIDAGTDGAMWFAIRDGAIGRVNPSGQVQTFPVPVSPNDVVVAPDGAIWFTALSEPRIFRMTTTGVLTSFVVPATSGYAPIALGPEGDIWFGGTGRIGRVARDGTVSSYDLPVATAAVTGLTAGPDGAMWCIHTNPNGAVRVALVQGPDLSVTLTSAGTPQSGPIVYTIGVGNVGNQDASGVVVNQAVPLRTRFRPDISTGSWTCSPDGSGGSFCSATVGALARGATAQLQFSVDFVGATGIAGSSVFARSTVVDDRAHGPDLNLGNNQASSTIPEVQGQGCLGGPDYLNCCATELISCFFFPDSGCASGNPPNPVQRVFRKRGFGALGALGTLAETARGLVLYYRVRDELFARTSGGRRLTELYYRHDPEIKRLLLADASLRESAFATLSAWAPTLQDLADGRTGDPVTQGQVDRMLAFLAALESKAGPELANAIARERRDLGLAGFAGLTPAAVLQRADHFSCTAADTALCLNGGRFRVEAAWKDFAGNSGVGHAVARTGDTGVFWFFSANNVELVVKALDGRAVNGRYWLFYGALSNVEYTITVTDTATGTVKSYVNPSGTLASVADTSAFAP